MLGIRELVVLVNKMDLVAYRKDVFEAIQKEFSAFLGHWGLKAIRYIPVSGSLGENILHRSAKMDWFKGGTVQECLSSFSNGAPLTNKPFRMWVQDVYKFTSDGDTRRIVAGTIESGSVRVGDHVFFHPSGKKAALSSIEGFNAPEHSSASAGEATGFTVSDKIFISRGELATKTDEKKPSITSLLRVSLFWLGREPMVGGKDYTLKIGTAKVPFRLENVHSVQDGSLLELKKSAFVGRHEIADCDLQLTKAIAFDLAEEIPATGRFVIVEDFEIRGGGNNGGGGGLGDDGRDVVRGFDGVIGVRIGGDEIATSDINRDGGRRTWGFKLNAPVINEFQSNTNLGSATQTLFAGGIGYVAVV